MKPKLGSLKKGCLIISLFLLVLMLTGCGNKDFAGNNSTSGSSDFRVEDGFIVLNKEGRIPDNLCEERGLEDKIVVLESKYCGACKVAVPIMKEVEEELGADILFLDLSEKADNLRMNGFRVLPHYTPTMLAGCDVYIGVKSKEDYHKIISTFLG